MQIWSRGARTATESIIAHRQSCRKNARFAPAADWLVLITSVEATGAPRWPQGITSESGSGTANPACPQVAGGRGPNACSEGARCNDRRNGNPNALHGSDS